MLSNKLLHILVLSVACLIILIISVYPQNLELLVGEWKFEKASSDSTIAFDSSIYFNHGQIHGAEWCNGKINNALTFSDSNHYVQIPASPSIAAIDSQITISCWIKPEFREAKWTTIIQRSNKKNGWMDFQIYAKAVDTWNEKSPAFRIDWNGNEINDPEDEVVVDTVLADDQWYFITCTYDGKNLNFYIDGILRNSTEKAGGVIPNSGRNIWIGANETWSKEYFKGTIDEVRIYSRALDSTEINKIMLSGITAPTGIENSGAVKPDRHQLYQNYPNPFNPSTRIKYSINSSSFVTIKVYNLLGKEVATLVNEYKPEGIYETEFDGGNLTNGVYFYTLNTENYSETKKLILLK